jgi:uncharacterized membrane protein YjgN (DUF898 family)
MAGDERTQFPPEQEPIVRRRSGDIRQAPGAPAAPRLERGPAPAPPGEDDSTRPPPGVAERNRPLESYAGVTLRRQLVENGRFGELFVLFIINILLGIVTLGVYRFWGKTRIRKYIWSRMSFLGERFEYAGTGMELFLGFLFALVVFGPPFLGFYAWIYFDPPPQDQTDPEFMPRILEIYGVGLILVVIAFYFIHVATFAAYRYRASRTIWRGIRGAVSGNAWLYGFLGFGFSFLNGVSLGWTKPWADTVLLKYRFDHTTVGSEPLACRIQAGPLYAPFAAAWLLTMVATILAIAGIAGLVFGFREMMQRPTDQPPLSFLILVVLLYLLVPVVWLITINFYRAALIRQIAGSTTLSGLSFRFPVGGWALMWFNVSNFFLVLLTLGLLLPLVILRYGRFIARYFEAAGEIDYASLRQTPDRGPRYGEGIAEFFGLGVV